MVGWVTPFVGDDFVEFTGDTVSCVVVEAVEIPPRRVGEFPVPLTHCVRVLLRQVRIRLLCRRYYGYDPHESELRY